MEDIVKKYWPIGLGVAAVILLMASGGRRVRRRKLKPVIKIKRAGAKRKKYVKKQPDKKPAWMIKGSEAARRHMAKLRKLRRA